MNLWDVTKYQNATMHPEYLSNISAWHGHIPFAYWITQVSEPNLFVELGVHAGDSYMNFLQGIRQSVGVAKAFGVDTWQGDKHAGEYGDAQSSVYGMLAQSHSPMFGRWSALIRKTFDEAAGFLPDDIDLLHIDGLHTYDAVRHDFETWLPKMSRKGIVLFHDTAAEYGDFGVWKLWREEIQPKYPTFEFFHSSGLGMALVGAEQSEFLLDVCSAPPEDAAWIRKYFELLAERFQRFGSR